MSFRNLVTTQVNNAFNLIGDLGEPISFTRMLGEYDLADQDDGFDQTQLSEVNIIGVISQQTRDVEDSSVILTQVILKSSDVTANAVVLDNYDTISFRNKTWEVNNYDDNGYIVTIFVRRSI